MELIKRKENYANPANTAKKNFFAIGFLYIILGILFFTTKPTVSVVILVAALVVLIAAYLLKNNKLRKLLSKNGPLLIKKLGFEKKTIVEKTLKLYRKTIENYASK